MGEGRKVSGSGVAQGGGGSLSIDTRDGHTFELRDATGASRRVTLRRRGGDPQLLSVGEGSEAGLHGEL